MNPNARGVNYYEAAPTQPYVYLLMAVSPDSETTHPITTYRTFGNAKAAADRRNSEKNGTHYVVWEFTLND